MDRRSDQAFEFGPFRADTRTRTLERDGQPVALSGKAFEILTALLRRPGEVVDKETLMREVWPDTAVEDNNLTVNISWLRKALGEAANDPRYIVTVPGRGYRFIGEIQPAGAVEETVPRSKPRGVTAWAWIALALVCTLAAVSVFMLRGDRAAPPRPSLAVLPLRVLNGNSKIDYLGVGLADSLITRLGALGEIAVRPLSSTMKVAERDPIAAGRELGADAVVSGSVQLDNDRIRVTVQMVRVRDGTSLWAQTFDDQMTNPFALEDTISSRVATSLLSNITGAQRAILSKLHTRNQEAYENYLRGRYHASRYTEEGFEKALAYLRKAIDVDPSYALAYSGLADCYYAASNLLLPPREAMTKAKAAAERSVEIDPSVAEAHVSLGIVASKFDWDWREAETQFQKALAIDPNLAAAHLWYGLFRAQLGDLSVALSELRRARELDPLSADAAGYSGTALYWARRYGDALAVTQRAIEFDPAYFPAYVSKAWILESQGDSAQAVAACEKARALSDSPWVMLALARAHALAGDRGGATGILGQLQNSAGKRFVSDYDLATVSAALGDKDRAFALLEQAYQSRSEWLSYIKIDPQLDSLRSDARFAALLHRMAL